MLNTLSNPWCIVKIQKAIILLSCLVLVIFCPKTDCCWVTRDVTIFPLICNSIPSNPKWSICILIRTSELYKQRLLELMYAQIIKILFSQNYMLALTKPKYLRIGADVAVIPYVWHSAIIFGVFSHSSSQHIVDAIIV